MIGLTEDDDKWRRWQVCSPEVARAVDEFKSVTVLKGSIHTEFHHHEDTKAFQQKFEKDVHCLKTELINFGNPFMIDADTELIQLDTKDVMGDNVVATVRTIEKIGKENFEEFRKSRIINQTTKLDAVIKKNMLPTFKATNTKGQSSKSESKDLKLHVRLFSQLYISTQIRGADMNEFFSHETLKCPPSLSKNGELRSGNKADLVKCIDLLPNGKPQNEIPSVPAAVLEGSVLVNQTKPVKEQSFKKYCSDLFSKQVRRYMTEYKSERIDLVFDTYKIKSLKETARNKRGKGVRRKVQDNTIAPSNWRGFLRLSENKKELFKYLSLQMLENWTEHNLVCAFDDICESNNPSLNIASIKISNHEEADTRVLLHASNLASGGFSKITIRTVDTDVLVLAIATFSKLKIYVEEFWIDFGSGKNRRFYPIHAIFEDIGEEKAQGMPFFHAFTGCDQVSFLANITKSSAWKIWCSYDEITPYFKMLSQQPTILQVEDAGSALERFVVLLYQRTSNFLTTNECRRDLFCQGRSIDNIPPTSAALKMHTLRASYIAGHVWGQCTIANQVLPDPVDWGWKEVEGNFVPHWTYLPEASIGIRDLIRCSCKSDKGCRKRCKCVQSDLQCTELCQCKGQCDR